MWPDTFVSDDGLKRCISELRRVFEDDAREPRVIETIPNRGYRLLAPVELVNETKAAPLPTPPMPASDETVDHSFIAPVEGNGHAITTPAPTLEITKPRSGWKGPPC